MYYYVLWGQHSKTAGGLAKFLMDEQKVFFVENLKFKKKNLKKMFLLRRLNQSLVISEPPPETKAHPSLSYLSQSVCWLLDDVGGFY